MLFSAKDCQIGIYLMSPITCFQVTLTRIRWSLGSCVLHKTEAWWRWLWTGSRNWINLYEYILHKKSKTGLLRMDWKLKQHKYNRVNCIHIRYHTTSPSAIISKAAKYWTANAHVITIIQCDAKKTQPITNAGENRHNGLRTKRSP